MRPVFPALDLFRGDSLPHEHARELEVIDQILCDNPTDMKGLTSSCRVRTRGQLRR